MVFLIVCDACSTGWVALNRPGDPWDGPKTKCLWCHTQDPGFTIYETSSYYGHVDSAAQVEAAKRTD